MSRSSRVTEGVSFPGATSRLRSEMRICSKPPGNVAERVRSGRQAPVTPDGGAEAGSAGEDGSGVPLVVGVGGERRAADAGGRPATPRAAR